MRPLIICDVAERRSGVPDLLARAGCDVEIRSLAMGDYLLSAALAVERKTSNDLVASILSGRLLHQLSELSASCEQALLLIEGDAWQGDRRLRAPMLARIYHWVTLKPNLDVIYAPAVTYSARLLAGLARLEQTGHSAQPPQPLPATRTRSTTPAGGLQGLPGVGSKTASRLLERFGTIRAVCTASQSDLCDVLGPVRGAELHQFLSRRQTASG